MAYVAIGILFLLVLAGGITMFVMANTRNSSRDTAEDDRTSGATPFSGPDHTPVGDTAQHAGEQDRQGRTVTANDVTHDGGAEEPGGGRYKRDPIGGEGEGESIADVGSVPHPRSR